MKKILLLLLITTIGFAQKNSITLSSGAFFNTSLSDAKNMLGATIEYDRTLNNGLSIGYVFGYYCLTKDKSFSELKLNIPIYDFGKFNVSVSGGAGYFHTYNDLLLEYDLNFNAKLNYSYSLAFTLSKTSAFMGEFTSLNIGLTKNF